MASILLNPSINDLQRRNAIFEGAIVLFTATPGSEALCLHARNMVLEAFSPHNPEHAQEHLTVEKFVDIVGPLKSRFTNDAKTKQLVKEYLLEKNIFSKTTYFDVPRLRIVPHSTYLTSGVSYAYKPHRDIWYASPTSQINWWLPVWDVTPNRSMAFYPKYWNKIVPNTSKSFHYNEWVRVGRTLAISQIKTDTRLHPLPLIELELEEDLRFGGNMGDSVVFSAAHLHATVPNTSECTRFSIDFRTINIDDLLQNRQAPNIDSNSSGTTLGDFLSVADLSILDLDRFLEVK
ncbi:MAG TPA: hypothetical protein P5280_06500 [Cyclobacteriaceae bacterium]|mgnify:CR=1 FL=1|nr:hypothetical protein [Cyclobacteriaceae bacterium]